jgi:hypothetical protein
MTPRRAHAPITEPAVSETPGVTSGRQMSRAGFTRIQAAIDSTPCWLCGVANRALVYFRTSRSLLVASTTTTVTVDAALGALLDGFKPDECARCLSAAGYRSTSG